jgi:hypothetical protein
MTVKRSRIALLEKREGRKSKVFCRKQFGDVESSKLTGHFSN